MLNKHFKKQLESSNNKFLPNSLLEQIVSEFLIMSYLNIDNDEDQNKFFLIRKHVPEIIFMIFNQTLNDKMSQLISVEVFKNRKKYPVGTLLELIEAIDFALKKMMPQNVIPKIAYPKPNGIDCRPKYDITRWVDITRKIYDFINKGYTKEQAHDFTINKWDPMEKRDYKQWLSFYQERVPEKYPKLAQDNSIINIPNIPTLTRQYHHNPNILDSLDRNMVQDRKLLNLPRTDIDEVRDTIEKQRNKLIGRLNAAEKLLSSMNGQLFAGDDQELMIKLLQDLKRKIMTSNKRSAKSSLFEDHIYKTANLLNKNGKNKAAGFFYKLAQLPDLSSLMGGISGDTEETPVSTVENQTPIEGNKNQTHDLLKEFFDNLKLGISSDKDDTIEERHEAEKKSKLVQSIPATQPISPVQTAPVVSSVQTAPPIQTVPPVQINPSSSGTVASVNDVIKIGSGYWHPVELEVFAQEIPALKSKTVLPEVNLPVINQVEADSEEEDKTDDIIEAALKGVTVDDVISRLEMLVSIYNQREISRQLAILDIMMDKIGIASFFPSLGEAMSKALEANQYIGNRLAEIMAKVKGSVNMPGASQWIEVQQQNNPETANIRGKLEQQQMKEDRAKELRHQKDIAKLEGKPANEALPIGTSVDLNRPVKVEKAPPIQVR
jgi:hypothetical protein